MTVVDDGLTTHPVNGVRERVFIHDPAIDETLPRPREARALGNSLLRPHRRVLGLLLLVAIVENAARLAVPLLVRRGIDHGIPSIAHGGPARGLLLIVGALCTVVAIHGISRAFFLNRAGLVRLSVMLDLRRRLFGHFQRLDNAFHDRYPSGRVVSRLTNDADAVEDMLAAGFDCLITAALTPLGIAVLLMVLDWRLGLMCLAAFPLLLTLGGWFYFESTKNYRATRESTALVIMQFIEAMSGIKVLQANRSERRSRVVFEDIADQYRRILERSYRLMAVFTPGVKLVGNVTIGVVLLYGGSRVLHGHMTIGTFAAFLLYLRMFFEPMHEITHFCNALLDAHTALEKLAAALNRKPAIEDPPTPRVPVRGSAPGSIVFRDVHFGYAPGRPVLSGFSLAVSAGQTVALVGRTGAGKTTVANLVARFYDPTAGSITLDGVDLRDLAQADLRRQVAMVTQENFLFSGTIADNIRIGRPDATEAEVRAAATKIGADGFIEALPDGYHTRTDGGVLLSASQRQLITLARVFLSDAAVLIVDEATSSLDLPSERMVQRALATVFADRTAVVIADRPDAVEGADRVVVLGELGQVISDSSAVDQTA